MLKRKVNLFLKEWKENINKKPLIISGARQIGKKTSIREFGKEYESFTFPYYLVFLLKRFFKETEYIKWN